MYEKGVLLPTCTILIFFVTSPRFTSVLKCEIWGVPFSCGRLIRQIWDHFPRLVLAYLRFKDWRDFRNAIPVVSVASSFEICLLSGFWNAKFGKSMSGKCSRCLHICNVFKVEDVVRRSWEPVAIKAVMVVKACAKTPSGKIQNETFGKYVVLWVGNILERQNGSHWKMCNTLKVSLQWQTNLHQFNVLFTPCLFYHAAPQRQYIKKQNYMLLTFHKNTSSSIQSEVLWVFNVKVKVESS